MADKIKEGARQAVVNCVQVKENERVVIITDEETFSIGEAIKDEALAITKNVSLFVMEDYGDRDFEPLWFPQEIAETLSEADVSFYAAGSRQGELNRFRKPMIGVVQDNRIRHAHMPGVNKIIMETGMHADYSKVQEMCSKVFNIVMNASTVSVRTKAGTDFEVWLNPEYKWVVSDGQITSEDWSNLPDGEVFTCAGNVNGKVVVDGVLGDYFDDKYGLIKQPLFLEIVDDVIVDTMCDNKELLEDFNSYIKQDENASRIGEFAIGCNYFIKELIGSMLQDEKYPGVHIAAGHGYPEKTGVKWDSEAHCDMVLRDCSIWVDGLQIMKDGNFLEWPWVKR